MFKGIDELALIETDFYWRGILIASTFDALHGHWDQIVQRCRHLERINVPISTEAATTYWTWFRDLPGNHSYKPLLIKLVGFRIYEHQDDQQIAFVNTEAREVAWFDGQSWQRFMLPEDGVPLDHAWHHYPMLERGFRTAYVGQPRLKFASSATVGGLVHFLMRYRVPKDFFDRSPCSSSMPLVGELSPRTMA